MLWGGLPQVNQNKQKSSFMIPLFHSTHSVIIVITTIAVVPRALSTRQTQQTVLLHVYLILPKSPDEKQALSVLSIWKIKKLRLKEGSVTCPGHLACKRKNLTLAGLTPGAASCLPSPVESWACSAFTLAPSVTPLNDAILWLVGIIMFPDVHAHQLHCHHFIALSLCSVTKLLQVFSSELCASVSLAI